MPLSAGPGREREPNPVFEAVLPDPGEDFSIEVGDSRLVAGHLVKEGCDGRIQTKVLNERLCGVD